MRRVLIANRGEIAVRIIRACRERGIATVAVCAEPDRDALYARLADERVALPGAAARDTYLDIGRLIDAARRSGADAVHPGYGFLAESPGFAEAVAEAGLAWVGPPADVIARLGDKTAARRLAEAQGVPVVPGYDAPDASDAALAEAAVRLGPPLMIKAASGGGGRGMRRVGSLDELPDALRSARREALAAFGRDALLLERDVDDVRHVEVQVLADGAEHVWALGERECSIQRRHQKIVEESPSPFVTPELRARLERAAVAVARAAGYVNVGTVEFLVDPERRFYFLEVNTRLQVEHPVTEAVTGLDLVAWQLRVASGDRLPAPRAEPHAIRGNAIECRVTAEDPAHDFRPTPGPILTLVEPRGPGVRVDSGLRAGWRVPVEYDPMLSKVIARGETREAAIARMDEALAGYVILGCTTNLEYLRAIVRNDAFRRGDTTTRFLERHLAGWSGGAADSVLAAAAVIAVLGAPDGEERRPEADAGGRRRAADPWDDVGPWRLGAPR